MTDQRPLSTAEALDFEEVAGATVLETVMALRAGNPTAKMCVAAMLAAHRRAGDDVTPGDIIAAYPDYLDLVELATRQLTIQTGDGG